MYQIFHRVNRLCSDRPREVNPNIRKFISIMGMRLPKNKKPLRQSENEVTFYLIRCTSSRRTSAPYGHSHCPMLVLGEQPQNTLSGQMLIPVGRLKRVFM